MGRKKQHKTQNTNHVSSGIHCDFKKKNIQWRLHNCGNTTEATTLLQQFFKKTTKKKKASRLRAVVGGGNRKNNSGAHSRVATLIQPSFQKKQKKNKKFKTIQHMETRPLPCFQKKKRIIPTSSLFSPHTLAPQFLLFFVCSVGARKCHSEVFFLKEDMAMDGEK